MQTVFMLTVVKPYSFITIIMTGITAPLITNYSSTIKESNEARPYVIVNRLAVV